MKPAAADDVYDGHGRYAAEAELALSWLAVRRFAEFAVSGLAGWTLAYWAYLAKWPDNPAAVDRIFGGIWLGIVGFFGFLLFSAVIGDLGNSRRTWQTLAGASIGAFLLGFLLPSMNFDRQIDAAKRESRQARESHGATTERVHIKWYDDLHAAGAHGPPGMEPPMLLVQDLGRRVQVRNIGDREIHCVSISRGNWIMRANRQECARLVPGAWATFENAGNNAEVETAPLVFQVGDPFNPEPSWWSDEALKKRYGQEFELERSDVR